MKVQDVFLCHANEDKAAVVDPLHENLEKESISCWLDREEIQWGDSITQRVNHGLSQARFAIVVLSEAFLAKPWPKRELHAILNLEASSGQVKVLPLIYGDPATVNKIYKEFPLLNDKLHVVWNGDPAPVVNAMLERLGRTRNGQRGKSPTKETLVVREKYYVLLLIDSSESMLWPYLRNPASTRDSEDWKEATQKVRSAISSAHAMALESLRNSRICKDRSLYVYQYLFNDRKIILNPPEELSPIPASSPDKVFRITEDYYTPISTTALYDTILEALVTVRHDFLQKAREQEYRIDRLIIGVITDGDDTVVAEKAKPTRITKIRDVLASLRDVGTRQSSHLVSSVLIGLTSTHFTKDALKRLKQELSFDDAISLDQSDPQAIRRAFKLFSSDAAQL